MFINNRRAKLQCLCLTGTQILAVLVAGVWACFAQSAPRSAGNLGCLLELELPRFAVANTTPAGGTVHAEVLLGAEGKIAELKAHGTTRDLELEVEYHLRSTAKYRSDCGGQTVELEFEFRVEGEPSYCPPIKTRFLPPNRFIIVTGPLSPSMFNVPIPKDRKKTGK